MGLLDWLNSGARNVPQGTAAENFRQYANPDAILNNEVVQQLSGLLGPMAAAKGLLGAAGVMTYHGTPHNVSAWDLSKVGTGQGAQSYGHGIYFAENPATAQSYQEMLAGKEIVSRSGQPLSYATTPSGTRPAAEASARRWVNFALGDIGEALRMARPNGNPETIRMLQKWQDAGAKMKPLGNVYKQDLPDEVLPKMLQWDKPLSEHPQAIQDALAPYISQKARTYRAGTGLSERHPSRAINTATGESIYNEVLGGGEKAQGTLSQLGIPGLSYLDAGSRVAGSGTMNHVIWDQELLNRMTPQAIE